jgi:hypothetical protein
MNVFFVISIICLALCLIMFFYLRWLLKNRNSASGLEEYKTEAARLIVDINSVTDRNLQLVEDSISKLKTILEETAKRIEEYKNAIEIKPASGALYTNLGRGIRAALLNPSEQMPSQQMQTEPLHKSRQITVEPQNFDEFNKIPSGSEGKKNDQTLPDSKKPASVKQIRSAIDLLINEGVAPEEIASRLDISIAQVNLAMNLRRKKR